MGKLPPALAKFNAAKKAKASGVKAKAMPKSPTAKKAAAKKSGGSKRKM